MASAFNSGPEFHPGRVLVSRRMHSRAPPNGLDCGPFESGIDRCGGRIRRCTLHAAFATKARSSVADPWYEAAPRTTRDRLP